MRAVIQRVARAAVTVDGDVVGRIERGLFVLVCVERGDDDDAARRTAEKIVRLRCFADEAGKMNLDVAQVDGAVLLVSQFTLAADLSRKGRRPSFERAAPPDEARRLYELAARHIAATGVPVETGVFGASMACELTNDGPVTLWFDSNA